ncbi:DnaD domain protein [Enterococcus faecium]|nr:DnaD domain protein [Enterococcus faecium]
MSDSRKRRYYWMKLKEDFFDDDSILWLEEQPSGSNYAYFYLKLCANSLKTDGVLVRNVGEIIFPHTPESLSKLTNTSIDTVKFAIDLFSKIGLIKLGGDGEIIISQIDEFVGSETESARQKRVERAVKKSKLAIESTSATLSHNCRTEIDKEIDKDINKEIEKETSLKQLNSSDSVGIVKDMYYETINYNQKYLNSDLKKLKEYSEKYELTLLAILFHIVVLRKRTMGLAYANKIIESWDSKAIYTVENYYSSEESSNNPNFQKYITTTGMQKSVLNMI